MLVVRDDSVTQCRCSQLVLYVLIQKISFGFQYSEDDKDDNPPAALICVAPGLCALCKCVAVDCIVELQTKVREDFTITEKAHTSRAFSWFKVPTIL